MSKHFEKYPGLYAGAKAAGLNYVTVLQRVHRGMTVEAALSLPVNKRPTRTRAEREAIYTARWEGKAPWERSGYKVAERKPVVKRERYVPRTAEDKSPPHIQRIRTALCNEFVKSGNLNTELQTELKDYADECRATEKYSRGVCAEHAPCRRDRTATPAEDDCGRDVAQADDAAARRIADFLRT